MLRIEDKARHIYDGRDADDVEGDLFDEAREELRRYLTPDPTRDLDPAHPNLNPNYGNYLLVLGQASSWLGPVAGIRLMSSLDDAIYGMGGDVTVEAVADVNGLLVVDGSHHDGSASIEVMQLTDAGQALVEECELDGGWYVPDDGIEVLGETYKDCDMSEVLLRIWNAAMAGDESLAALPRFAQAQWGAAAEEKVVELPGATTDIRLSRTEGRWEARFDDEWDTYAPLERFGSLEQAVKWANANNAELATLRPPEEEASPTAEVIGREAEKTAPSDERGM
jgi:hypothetical protein